MRLRRRIEQSRLLARALGGLVALWLRFCRATTRWDLQGLDDLTAALRDGPVILVLWHECTMMAPAQWPAAIAPLSSLHDTSPIGRVSGAVQGWFGLMPMPMADGTSNRAASRQVLRRLEQGVSVGLTGDGPLGPVHVLKGAALEWARVSGRPVFVYGFALSRQRRLATWDQMILPLPFGRGRAIWRLWHPGLPRRADAATRSAEEAGLAAALTAVTQDAARP
jgi:lysophospholipid acyltransferase (LPLAT)-like uncharacterized protein